MKIFSVKTYTHYTLITALLSLSSIVVYASESSIAGKVSTWLTDNTPSTGCALVGTIGFSLEALPEKTQRDIYKKCGWYFLGVSKDGKEITAQPRHPHAFTAIDPSADEYARASFLKRSTKWDTYADEILKRCSNGRCSSLKK